MKHRASILCLSALALAGCVMPDELAQIQKDLADVRAELRKVQQSQGDAAERVRTLEQRVGGSEQQVARSEIADLKVSLERTRRDVDVNGERLGEVDRRIDRMAEELRQARSSSPAPPPATWSLPESRPGTIPGAPPSGEPAAPGSASTPDAESLYNTAYADFSKGNYALAISGFAEFAEKFEDSPLADNALYWIGECHYSRGDFATAIRGFDDLLRRYPDTDKAAAADLKKALAYLELNQIGQAIVQLRYVDTRHPGSDEARIARDKLTSLGAPL